LFEWESPFPLEFMYFHRLKSISMMWQMPLWCSLVLLDLGPHKYFVSNQISSSMTWYIFVFKTSSKYAPHLGWGSIFHLNFSLGKLSYDFSMWPQWCMPVCKKFSRLCQRSFCYLKGGNNPTSYLSDAICSFLIWPMDAMDILDISEWQTFQLHGSTLFSNFCSVLNHVVRTREWQL
jgi:hypothetical protein